MATGDVIKLGTLYLGGIKTLKPTKPWRIDSEPYAGAGVGNIASYASGSAIEIRNTDTSDIYKLQWIEINENGKKYLICDRVILVNIPWSALESQSLIFGKVVTVDGQTYKLRLLTGGLDSRNGDSWAGGTPTNNEWDRWVINEAGLSGLLIPVASDLDTSTNSTDLNSAHNQKWHWMGINTWCQETYTGDGTDRVVRGDRSARKLGHTYYLSGNLSTGWRPVLEVFNPPTLTLTSPADNQTLTEGKTYSIAGSATDVDNGNVVTIKYNINNWTARAINSGVSDGSTPIAFSKNLTYRNKRLWDGSTDVVGADLAENADHTLTIWAEDDQGGKSPEVTRKFRVVWNRPPTISGKNGDLGTFLQPPTVEYSAIDPEGNTFTFTEYLNGKQIRSFDGTAGENYVVQIDHDAWIRLDLDVQHEIRIRATDSAGSYSERVYTFTRTETHIEFVLNFDNPDVQAHFVLDGMPQRVLVTLERYIPEGATIESVKVCNNALDASPTWEDATNTVKTNRGYLFTNTTKTAANWAINIWVVIAKGSATERVKLNGFGGAFD